MKYKKVYFVELKICMNLIVSLFGSEDIIAAVVSPDQLALSEHLRLSFLIV